MTKIPPDVQEFLLKVAWKKMTLNQIAIHTGINISTLKTLYTRHDIEPVKKRDLVASKLIDLYNTATEPLGSNREIALLLDCSEVLVKEIIRDYNLKIKIRKYKTGTQEPVSDREVKIKAAKKRDQEIIDTAAMRTKFAVYTQSGSELLDSVRQINTTGRPKTLLTNATNKNL